MKINKLLFLIAVLASPLFFSCEKDDLKQDVPRDEPFDETWGEGDSVPLVARHYFRGKIDSEVVVLQDSIRNYISLFSSIRYGICGGDSAVEFMGFGTVLRPEAENRNSIEIQFLSCVPDSATPEERAATIYQGAYPFGSTEIGARQNGVLVIWTDSDGNQWKSRPSTGALNNYRFQLTEPLTDEDASYGSEYYIEGVVDLDLFYGSQSIRLERGEFRLKMSDFE